MQISPAISSCPALYQHAFLILAEPPATLRPLSDRLIPSLFRNFPRFRQNRETSNLAPICLALIYLNRARRSRSELVTTETELKAIAAEAIMGFSRTPKIG